MKRFVIFIVLGLSLILSACNSITFSNGSFIRGSGNLSSETRPVSGFSQIVVNGSGDAQITVGDTESLKIEAEDNILPLITSEVIGDKLVLGFKNAISISTSRPIRYTISAKALNGVELNGSGNATIGDVKSDSMALTLRGSGDVSLASFQGSRLSVDGNGSGNVKVNGGKIDSQDLRLFGSGSIKAANLESRSASITIAGSGNADLWAKETLTVNIGGSGNVTYYGTPVLHQTVAGSGHVNGLGNK